MCWADKDKSVLIEVFSRIVKSLSLLFIVLTLVESDRTCMLLCAIIISTLYRSLRMYVGTVMHFWRLHIFEFWHRAFCLFLIIGVNRAGQFYHIFCS